MSATDRKQGSLSASPRQLSPVHGAERTGGGRCDHVSNSERLLLGLARLVTARSCALKGCFSPSLFTAFSLPSLPPFFLSKKINKSSSRVRHNSNDRDTL